MKEGKVTDIEARIEAVGNSLNKGTWTIKLGHKVKGVSPEGDEMTIPFTANQKIRREEELTRLEGVLERGKSCRKRYKE